MPKTLNIPADTLKSPQLSEKENTTKTSSGGKGGNSANVYAYVFYMLLESMSIRQETVTLQSKQISDNASAQNKLNVWIGDVHFKITTSNASEGEINYIQEENQALATYRDNLQNDLITSRQQGQVQMTIASSNVNILEQNASEDSGWLQTLNTIYQAINAIGQPKK